MPYQPIGKYAGSRGFARKTDFKRPVTFYDRVRFVGDDSTMEIFGGVLSGDISADLITLGTLDADRIAVGSLDGDKITAATLTADEIAVGTITTDRLVIGSNDNLLQDPHFKNSTTWTIVSSGGGGAWTFNNSGGFGAELRFAPPVSSDATLHAADVACNVGDVFFAEIKVFCGNASGGSATIKITERLGDGSYNSQITTASFDMSTSSGWEPISLSHTVASDDTELVRFEVQVNAGSTISTYVAFNRALMRRKVGTLVIEGQAVDIERMLDPVFVDTGGGTTVADWTTTMNDKHTETLTIPSWVGSISVYAYASGSKVWVTGQWVEPRLRVGAAIVGTGRTQRVVDHVGAVYAHGVNTIAAPGSSITLICRGQVLTTTEVNVASVVKYTATGVR